MFGVPNPGVWYYRLCTRIATTEIIDALVGAGLAFPWFWDYIFWGFLCYSCYV